MKPRADRHQPRDPADLERLIKHIGGLWWIYIKGQMLLALITGGMVWALGVGIGLSWPLVLGLLAGILDVIPTFGPIIAVVPAVVVAFWRGSSVLPVQNWAFALIVLAGFIAIQQIVSLLIAPQILGRRLDLPPLLVLAAVTIGALVANVVGAYLAIPLLVTAREVLEYTRRKARGLPPFAEDDGGAPEDAPADT
jgi:predicted PurR-regulated permease PerM